MQRLTITLSDEDHETLRKQAFLKKQSMSQVIGALLSKPLLVVTSDNLIKEYSDNPKLPKSVKKQKIIAKPITRAYEGLTRGELDVDNYF